MRILILGGTSEASALAVRLAGWPDLDPLLSLAGRTSQPRPAAIPVRVGGFGGPEGLVRFLVGQRIAALVDATHPFAAVISRNAAWACAAASVPLLALTRPPWQPEPGDRWIEVATMDEAASALGLRPRRVFLTVGRMELRSFAAAPQHSYLVRTIEPIGDALPAPDVTAIRDRPPFDAVAERDLMERERVEVVVTKNSGAAASYPKLAAARGLRLPVVMVRRPDRPEGVPSTAGPEAALAWIDDLRRRAPRAHGRHDPPSRP